MYQLNIYDRTTLFETSYTGLCQNNYSEYDFLAYD